MIRIVEESSDKSYIEDIVEQVNITCDAIDTLEKMFNENGYLTEVLYYRLRNTVSLIKEIADKISKI